MNTITLPNPLFKVVFREEEDKHLYDVPEHDKFDLGSVTHFLDIIGGEKTNALIGWSKKKMGEVIKAELMARFQSSPDGWSCVNEDWIDEIIKKGKAKPKKLVEEAGDFGSKFHHYADLLIQGQPISNVPEELVYPLSKFKEWWDQSEFELIAPDTPVASLKYGFGGKLDWLVRHRPTGRIVVGDNKTSNGIRDDYALQVGGAYWQGLKETFGVNADAACIVRFSKVPPKPKRVTKKSPNPIQDPGFEVKWVRNLPLALEGFLCAKRLTEILAQELYA